MRNERLDLMKGVGILLVILGHCGSWIHYNFIYSFHMPMFVIVSGFFFRDKPLTEWIKNGAKTLLLPYLVVTLLIPLKEILEGDMPTIESLQKHFMTAFFVAKGPWTEIFGVDESYGPIWFLVALFWCRIFYQILRKCTKHDVVWSFFISLASMLCGRYVISLPLGILLGGAFLFFYSIGHCWKQWYTKSAIPISIRVVLVVAWLLSVAFTFCGFRTTDLSNYNCTLYPLGMIGAVGGTYLLYLLVDKIPWKIRPFFNWVGENTLQMLCYHTLTPNLYGRISKWMLLLYRFVFPLACTYLHVWAKKRFKKER